MFGFIRPIVEMFKPSGLRVRDALLFQALLDGVEELVALPVFTSDFSKRLVERLVRHERSMDGCQPCVYVGGVDQVVCHAIGLEDPALVTLQEGAEAGRHGEEVRAGTPEDLSQRNGCGEYDSSTATYPDLLVNLRSGYVAQLSRGRK